MSENTPKDGKKPQETEGLSPEDTIKLLTQTAADITEAFPEADKVSVVAGGIKLTFKRKPTP